MEDHAHETSRRSLPTVQLEQLAAVAEKAAEAIRRPGAFTCEGVAQDARGNGVSIWSPQAVRRDVLGWVTYIATPLPTGKFRTADTIGMRILDLRGKTMIVINDQGGPEEVAAALLDAAASFRQEVEHRRMATRTAHLYKRVQRQVS